MAEIKRNCSACGEAQYGQGQSGDLDVAPFEPCKYFYYIIKIVSACNQYLQHTAVLHQELRRGRNVRRILITGASGFVGKHAMRIVREAFRDSVILGVGRRSTANIFGNVAYERLELNDQETVEKRISTFRPTDVIHLAAQSSVLRAEISPFDAWRINFGGLYHIIDALERNSFPCNLAFVSSGEVYGHAFLHTLPVTEETKPQPSNAYATSKLLGEQFLINALRNTCIKVIILRPFNHIGPGQEAHFAVSSFARQIARIEAGAQPPIVEVGNLDVRRDFLDVVDVVEAYVAILRQADLIQNGTIFNICSGNPRSIESALSFLRNASRQAFDVRISSERTRPSEIPVAFGDSTRIRKLAGWKQQVDWPTSLTRVLEDARLRILDVND